jgi:putative ubiquitin-RnfH superfamily antitoxin RatB of RatAB toxin-antitoxin module
MLMCPSCSTCSRQQTVDDITIDLADLAIDSSYVNIARKVFYALPTPIELAILIKNLGIDFQPALLNNPSNASKYLTNQKMALNFGAYTTDLTYAGLFEQSQTILRYKVAILRLTEGLGLHTAVDFSTIQEIEAKINDKNAVLRVISDTYASCTAALNENDRYFLTLAMFIGGWVEGMYIATSLTDEKLPSNENRMKQLIIDQKLTFKMIWQVMSDLKTIPEVTVMMNDLSEIAQLLDGVDTDNISTDVYVKIKNQVQSLRQNITNN